MVVGSGLTQVKVNNAVTSFSFVGNSITIRNLPSISAATTVAIQLSNVVNPSNTDPIAGLLSVRCFYSNSSDLISLGSYLPSELQFTGPQTLTYTVVSSSQQVMATNVSLTFTIRSQIGLPLGCNIRIIIHEMTAFATSTGCTLTVGTTTLVLPCVVALNSTYEVVVTNLSQSIGAGVSFSLLVANAFTNPSSTQPIAYFTVITYSSLGNELERSSSFSISYLSISEPAPFISFTLSRSSQINGDLSNYTFSFSQPSIFLTTITDANALSLRFPS